MRWQGKIIDLLLLGVEHPQNFPLHPLGGIAGCGAGLDHRLVVGGEAPGASEHLYILCPQTIIGHEALL